jgi:hypothetical protein
LVIFCLLLGSIVKTESYKSKYFPSNNIIKQAYNQSVPDNRYKIVQVLGILKDSDGGYIIFFLLPNIEIIEQKFVKNQSNFISLIQKYGFLTIQKHYRLMRLNLSTSLINALRAEK